MARILVVDDEPQIRRFLGISLAANGYSVCDAASGQAALAACRAGRPDLVILDLGLPDIDGQDVISALRAEAPTLPIIVLSVRSQEYDKVEALDRGADDYVVKPFGIAELMARIRAALRGPATVWGGGSAATGAGGSGAAGEAGTGGTGGARPPAEIEVLTDGSLVIDLGRRVITRDGQDIHLSRREYALLAVLARQPDHVLTHAELLRAVWGPAHVNDTVYLRIYVKQLRQKLEPDPGRPRLILTEPGVGYRLRLRDES